MLDPFYPVVPDSNWVLKLVPVGTKLIQLRIKDQSESEIRRQVCEAKAVCARHGDCELQDVAVAVGMDHSRFPYRWPQRSVDASHPLFSLDHNRCILCTRCVRFMDDVAGDALESGAVVVDDVDAAQEGLDR